MRGRLSAALCAAALVVASGPPAAADPARPRPNAAKQNAAKDPVAIAMTQMSPQTLTAKTKKLTVRAVITNSGPVALTGLTAQLSYGGKIDTRSELDQFARSENDAPGAVQVDASKPLDIPASGTADVLLTWTAPGAIGGADLATFPLMLKAVNAEGEQLKAQHSFVIYKPKNVAKTPKAKVSFVLPLLEQPHRTTDNVFLDDRLAASVSGTRRLNALLNAADRSANPGLTLAIDPGLLDDLNTMAAGSYFVDPPGSEVKGKAYPRNADAGTWLNTLKKMTVGGRVPFFFTPYGDPDSVALVRSKMGAIGKKGELSLLPAAYKKKEKGAEILGAAEKYPDLAWPINGVISQSAVNRLVVNKGKKLGSDIFLLSSSFFTPENLTPSATTTINDGRSKPHRVLAYDETLQDVISADTKGAPKTLAAEQRYLAETAVFSQEQPGVQRTLVLAPDRRWDPSPEFAEFLLNSGEGWGDWLKPTSLGAVARAPVVKRTPQQDQMKVANALPETYVNEIKQLDERTVSFGKVFETDNENLRTAPMRAASGYWRGDASRSRKAGLFLDYAVADVEKQINKIGVLLGGEDPDQPTERTRKGVTGSGANVQLIVANGYDEPVEVFITVESTDPKVLIAKTVDGKETNLYSIPLALGPKENTLIQVPMEQVGGSSQREVPVDVTIYNPAGGRPIRKQDFDVKTSDLSPIGWLITLGALAVVGLGVGFRGMRARRRRTEEETQHDGAAAG